MKGISGFFYVYVEGSGIITCKAKGIFRKNGIKPLVGDYVTLTITDEKDREGNIETILPRKNTLIRPAVSNVDQALYVIAGIDPKPNLNLLDRFLCMMEYQNVPSILCINKTDLTGEEELEKLQTTYEKAGYRVLLTAAKKEEGGRELFETLKGKTTTVAGPSGVGKSTLTNLLAGYEAMETGAISEKIKRGKNTTRHSECHALGQNTYLFDTPGFGSMLLPEIEKEDLSDLFPEFREPSKHCFYQGCAHWKEPDCGVKEALSKGQIDPSRYENYRLLYEELKSSRQYR